MKLIKDGMVMELDDASTASMYLDYGWRKYDDSDEKKSFVERIENQVEMTKKELQLKLDELKVVYKPQENKSELLGKLKKALPTDNFDDGLLKG
jgi:hypothetical protein